MATDEDALAEAAQRSDGGASNEVALAPPSAGALRVTVHTSYRGAPHDVTLSHDATLAELGAALAASTGAAPDSLRLLHAGRALSLHGASASTRTLREEALSAVKVKCLLLLGSCATELDAVRTAAATAAVAASSSREAPPEHEARRAAIRSGRGAPPPPRLPSGPYPFASFRVLQAPEGLTLTPSAAAAMRLLHLLAADPGIVAVMNARRWRVGLMSEMPPEGKVGVSERCVLGYNVNAGQEISLRLRTDDWRGFRRYERIRETLIHELAHNVFGPHDFKFKALNSELTIQANRGDWRRGSGRAVGGGSADVWEGWDVQEEAEEDTSVMGLTARDSGRPLGGGALLLSGGAPLSAADAAAIAAERRAAAASAAAAEAAMQAEAEAALAADDAPQTTTERPA